MTDEPPVCQDCASWVRTPGRLRARAARGAATRTPSSGDIGGLGSDRNSSGTSEEEALVELETGALLARQISPVLPEPSHLTVALAK
jgi:hypothetical protein